MKALKNQKGFVAIIIIIVVLFVILGIVFVLSLLTLREQKAINNTTASQEAYYLAEAGIEDALLKLRQDPSMPEQTYALNVESGTAQVVLYPEIGQSRVIASTGDSGGRIRKIEVVYELDSSAVSFHYGVQAGEGGIEIGNNARIIGNVFSNGDIVAPGGKGEIDNTVVVANNGNQIVGLTIGEDALAYSCDNCTIGGHLTYVSGGTASGCSAGEGTSIQPEEIQPESLPISQEQIEEWRIKAAAGGVIESDAVYDGVSNFLGPVQIGTPEDPKDLSVFNGANITLKGTVYVTGDINISNNAVVELDPGLYGSLSGILFADGSIIIGNNGVLRGSGLPGSYILVLSTSSSLNAAEPAILISNNAAGDIFYTTSGLAYVKNNVEAREVTGYKILLDNNAEVSYESGLESALFSNGPAGGWVVKSWKEVE